MAKTDRQATGKAGEALAIKHLTDQGYVVVETNWRCKDGEIDIIARQGDVVVFVEVRTRHALSPERAFESISKSKRDKLIRLAYAYVEAHDLEDVLWRIDVIAIAMQDSGQTVIEQAEDALGW